MFKKRFKPDLRHIISKVIESAKNICKASFLHDTDKVKNNRFLNVSHYEGQLVYSPQHL
jgi:hypothetical protein